MEALARSFCSQCGAALNAHDKFCSKCGTAVVGVDGRSAAEIDSVNVKSAKPESTETTAEQSFSDPQFGKSTKRSMSNTAKQSFSDPQFGKSTERSMSNNAKAILIAVSVGMVPLVLFALSSGDSSKSSSGDSTISATGDASKSFIKLAGEPDLIESSEYDNPRPPIVVKIFTYKKQNVKLTFVADAPLNTPPPYRTWALVDSSDAQTGESLPVDEFKRRMGLR